MSDAVVPRKANSSPPRARFLPRRWFGRMIESDVFYSFRRSRLTMVAAAVTVLFFLLAISASLLSVQNPFNPAELQLINSRISPIWTADGQSPFLLGTDEQGRDVFSAILYGLRISLQMGLVAGAVAFALGATVGATAAYLGGRIEALIMRVIDLQLSFPAILLSFVIAALLGQGKGQLIIALVA